MESITALRARQLIVFLHLLNSHHPVRLPCALSPPKNFAYRGPYRTIGAARMYRSLSKQGSFTEFSYDQRIPPTSPHSYTYLLFFLFSRSDPPGLPVINLHRDPYTDSSPMQFATVGTTSRSERTMAEAPVFVPADHTHIEFIPGTSATSLSMPAKSHSKETITYQTAQVRP